MNTLNVVAPCTPPETIHASLLEHGYVVVEDAAPETAAQAREELAHHIEETPLGHDAFLGAHTRRVGGLLAKSPAAQALAVHTLVIDLCERVLLPYSANYQLNFSGVMHLEPGAEAQELHRDGTLYPVRHPCPPMILATMWALSDFTEENGGTCVAPGSHLWAHERCPLPDEVLGTAMPAGSVLIYTGGTYHGGGRNRSNTVRTGLALHYSWSWLRQEENQYLANPPDIARRYPERLRRLIGYDYGGPYLGFVNSDDPHRLFEPGYRVHPMRSRPDIDQRSEAIDPLPLGACKTPPAPKRTELTADPSPGAPSS